MDAKRIIGTIIILVAVVVLVYLGIQSLMQYQEYGVLDWPQTLRGKGFSGNIVRVDEEIIEIQPLKGDKKDFIINKGTKIMTGDEKLKEGLYVWIIYKEAKEDGKEKNIAKAIRKPKKAPEKPASTGSETPGESSASPSEESPAAETPSDETPAVENTSGETPSTETPGAEVSPSGDESKPDGESTGKPEGRTMDDDGEKAPPPPDKEGARPLAPVKEKEEVKPE